MLSKCQRIRIEIHNLQLIADNTLKQLEMLYLMKNPTLISLMLTIKTVFLFKTLQFHVIKIIDILCLRIQLQLESERSQFKVLISIQIQIQLKNLDHHNSQACRKLHYSLHHREDKQCKTSRQKQPALGKQNQ